MHYPFLVQYTLATHPIWFWDGSASFRENNRLIFIGLNNRQPHYEWTSGVRLGFVNLNRLYKPVACMYRAAFVLSFSYSPWFEPGAVWQQSIIHSDSVLPNIVEFSSKQPSADTASRCVGMLSQSPFAAPSFIKIPCDYPIFRAGVICKKPALTNEVDITEETSFTPQIQPVFEGLT